MILGASFDTPEDQKAFAEEHGFPFPLLCDTDQQVGELYGVRREPGDPLYEFGVPKRISYLIDPEGVIRKAYEVEDIASHPDAVVADLKTLQGA